jgi:hypothetical protein
VTPAAVAIPIRAPVFSNGWFVGGGGIGLSMNGINQSGAFGNLPSLSYQGAQFGYDFKTAGGPPLKVYAGFDTLNRQPLCLARHHVRHTVRP